MAVSGDSIRRLDVVRKGYNNQAMYYLKIGIDGHLPVVTLCRSVL